MGAARLYSTGVPESLMGAADRDEILVQRMRNLHQHIARLDLWFVQGARNIIDSANRNTTWMDSADPLIRRARQEMRRENADDFIAVDHPVGIARKTRVFRQIRQADGITRETNCASLPQAIMKSRSLARKT